MTEQPLHSNDPTSPTTASFADTSSAYATATPPTDRGQYVAPPPKSVWPTVLGIIMIVFGSLGTLGAIWRLIGLVAMRPMLQNTPQGPMQLYAWDKLGLWVPAVSVLFLLAEAWLLTAGIQLLRRKANARFLSLSWTGVKVAATIFSMVVNYFVQLAQQEYAAQHQSSGAMAMQSVMHNFAMIGMVIGFLWAIALPAFLLIWMSRAKIKDEMAQWA